MKTRYMKLPDPVVVRRDPDDENSPTATLYYGIDAFSACVHLPHACAHTLVTSPPYWGLRDYEAGDGEIGQEATIKAFVQNLVAVFGRARRVLRPDGTVWLNIGDSYTTKTSQGATRKNLAGVPWRTALALQDVGWYLRSEIIWHKTFCLPENVPDRPTRNFEHIFLLSQQDRYYYDADAVREPAVTAPSADSSWEARKAAGHPVRYGQGSARQHGIDLPDLGRGDGKRALRCVWSVAPSRYPGAHFATFSEKLIEPCILAGCPEGGTVLDLFSGSATTGKVALDRGRNYIGIDLNHDYLDLAVKRLMDRTEPEEEPKTELGEGSLHGGLFDMLEVKEDDE